MNGKTREVYLTQLIGRMLPYVRLYSPPDDDAAYYTRELAKVQRLVRQAELIVRLEKKDPPP